MQITDWMPTFCAIAGYRSTGDLKWDGTDLTALLTDHQPLAERPLYAVGTNWRTRSLRWGDWKLIVQGQQETERIELFNLATDPSESQDLSQQQPARVQQLLSAMEESATCDRDAVVTASDSGDKR